ncbi:MAG: SufE family protein [Bacteriovoracaceae bacterium]
MSKTSAENVQSIVKKFEEFGSWELKYKHIIECGKKLSDFPDQFKEEKFKVKGCQSQVWLYPEIAVSHDDANRKVIHFHADSDASIVKGIIAVLLSVYNDLTPNEVLEVDESFIDTIGLRQHLSMSRANGLNSMIKQIKMYALVYKTQFS